jgi:hypothetical protein
MTELVLVVISVAESSQSKLYAILLNDSVRLEFVTSLRHRTTVTISVQTMGQSKKVGHTFKICAVNYADTDITVS